MWLAGDLANVNKQLKTHGRQPNNIHRRKYYVCTVCSCFYYPIKVIAALGSILPLWRGQSKSTLLRCSCHQPTKKIVECVCQCDTHTRAHTKCHFSLAKMLTICRTFIQLFIVHIHMQRLPIQCTMPTFKRNESFSEIRHFILYVYTQQT